MAAEMVCSHVDGYERCLLLTGSSVWELCFQSPETARWQPVLSWHTHTSQLAELRQGSCTSMCVCCCAWDCLGKIQQPPTSQVISHRAKKPCKAAQPLPRSIVFAIRNTRRQNGSNELSFHTGTACRSLLDPIKTSQIHGYNCRMCLLQLNPYTAVLT